jgi:hypothetical protein
MSSLVHHCFEDKAKLEVGSVEMSQASGRQRRKWWGEAIAGGSEEVVGEVGMRAPPHGSAEHFWLASLFDHLVGAGKQDSRND